MKKNKYTKIMKILLVVFLFSVTLFATSSKSYIETKIEIIDTPDVKAKDPVDWLLMFYMSGDIDWELHVIDSINELESGYTPGNVDVALMIDRHPGYDQSADNWSDTRYYHLAPGDDPMEIESEFIQSLGEKNMGNAINLRYFVTWAMDAYNADKTALFIFGHGGGLSGIGYDYSSNYKQMTLNEVQQAMFGFQIDLFAAEACGMGMLEIAYEMRTFTDYYLGNQRPMRIEALDYKAMIEELCANPLMEPWELGEVICQTYIDHNPYPAYEMYALINTSCLPELMTKLDYLSTNLSSMSTEYLEHLSDIREFMYYDDDHSTPDIQSMIDEIRIGFLGNTSLLQALDEFETEYHKAIVYKVQGKYASDSSGLGLFFPRDSTKIGKFTEYVGLTSDTVLEGLDFLADSLWDEFLSIYLASAEIIVYTPWVYRGISLNTEYQVDVVRGTLNVYGYYIIEPGIYNFTLSNIINEPSLIVENAESSKAVISGVVWSDNINPEVSSVEHISCWLETGVIYIVVESLTETSNGTLYVTKSTPIAIEVDQKSTGEFPYALGYIPPSSVYYFYIVDLIAGKYTIEIDIDWPVGLEVYMINGNGDFILEYLMGISGLDFQYNYTATFQQELIIGFCSYTGTGNFTFTIKIVNGTTSSTSISAFFVLPAA
ncbi:MAG: hypothetical protein FK733_16265, partial [Asgard group archaeon]|nr:hypothetical protein [Asgard group archaeon]